MVWTAHVNGRQHRDKVAQLKKPKPAESQFTKPSSVTAVKRKADTGCGPSPKKGVPSDFFDASPTPIKGILKNTPKPIALPQSSLNPVKSSSSLNAPLKSVSSQIPSKLALTQLIPSTIDVNQTPSNQKSSESGSLPEGFFDDPKLDAKVNKMLVN